MKKILLSVMALSVLATAASCSHKQKGGDENQKSEVQLLVEQYAPFDLTTDVASLSDNEKELIRTFIQIAEVMDDLFWEQSFGSANRAALDTISDPYLRRFADIQYGAWNRLDAEKPFLPGFGPKPQGANFYPVDMTEEEFNNLDDPLKTSQYSIIRRDADGNLKVVPYREAYATQLAKVDSLLGHAIDICQTPSLKKYLEARREAFRSDDYLESDMVWMDMKDSRLDFVVGPIENYEDALFGYKAAYEAFVLVKDVKWSNDLARFTKMLPELQKQLPCDPKYKQETPGTDSDLNVYDVVYYAGDCNAGSKTIAINLPNDERVHLSKGTRRLQLKNAMNAKFQTIMLPIANLMICDDQIDNVKFEAFFSNVCYHEVAHGLGIKNVVGKPGESVRKALQNQYSAYEEAKADIAGLFIVQSLIEKGEITGITVEDAYVTFIAGILRSVRFGASEAHGVANMMCFNYFQDHGAFTRDANGKYVINVEKTRAALEGWTADVIAFEGNGDFNAAKAYAEKNGIVRDDLKADLKKIEDANIPVDITYNQGCKVLFGE